mmetsp:Transcript_26148/g.80431  ORF Transcript_26148/g.80431 Transcript_26148/m.80431 type:complete len:222 (-) Transcript_26148:791-1456(-)
MRLRWKMEAGGSSRRTAAMGGALVALARSLGKRKQKEDTPAAFLENRFDEAGRQTATLAVWSGTEKAQAKGVSRSSSAATSMSAPSKRGGSTKIFFVFFRGRGGERTAGRKVGWKRTLKPSWVSGRQRSVRRRASESGAAHVGFHSIHTLTKRVRRRPASSTQSSITSETAACRKRPSNLRCLPFLGKTTARREATAEKSAAATTGAARSATAVAAPKSLR